MAAQAPVAALPFPVLIAETGTRQIPAGTAVVAETASAASAGSIQARVMVLA